MIGKLSKLFLALYIPIYIIIVFPAAASDPPYDGRVTHDVKRDRIMAISEDYATLYYYCGPENIDYSGYWGATCPDPTVGWKTGSKYCWGGEDTTKQYLTRMDDGDGAGNKWCSGSSSYDQFCAGADCSGMASNCWTSPRRYTASFHQISDNILWENLRMGDATNKAGSHIRIFDYYVSAIGTIMFYESTSGGGTLWKAVHRSLSRDTNYQPIRYNDPGDYKVYDYSEPSITYIKKAGVERVEVRWDGQADRGFRLYQSGDGSTWDKIRDFDEITSLMRTCEVSGLLPDTTHFFKMTSLNSGDSETIDSTVVAYRLDGFTPRVLLVDGADRYREQHGANHIFLTRVGAALGARGIGFDFCSNEAVVDEQIDLSDYEAVVWILAEESTFNETFSWPEQMHVTNFLKGGGRLFVSGSEIGWDLDHRANWGYYKNGSENDEDFYNHYLRTDYVSDDAGTYHVSGASGSIFDGLDFHFDDGTHGTYYVEFPDVITGINGGTAGLNYQGGTGSAACVYGSNPTSGTVVYFGFPFETIYPQSARNSVMKAILNYFDLPVEPPTIKTTRQTATSEITITWKGYASQGFRLFRKIGSGSWTKIQDEGTLNTDATSATVSGLNYATRYAFKVRAVNSGGASSDSDVLVCAFGAPGDKVLLVDGYDRWNSQHSGSNHTLLENFSDALSAHTIRYDSCTNECVADGTVSLLNYDIVMWMCGEESTESESFSYAEQVAVQDYVKAGGRLFVSGAEIGWDLDHKGNGANDYSNGSENDTPFYNNFLKANFLADNAGTYAVTGVSGTDFAGLSFNFDDGTHGTYDVQYPDVISTNAGSANALYYDTGSDVAGITFSGTFPGGSSPAELVYFGFPFETIYNATERSNVMGAVLNYFGATPSPVGVKLSAFSLY